MIVWVVDDDKVDFGQAEMAIESADLPAPHVQWVSDFALLDSPLPDLVILDLFNREGQDLVLRGDEFYCSLREREKAKDHRRAFVVVWSGYTGQRGAEQFVNLRPAEGPAPGAGDQQGRLVLKAVLGELVERFQEEWDA